MTKKTNMTMALEEERRRHPLPPAKIACIVPADIPPFHLAEYDEAGGAGITVSEPDQYNLLELREKTGGNVRGSLLASCAYWTDSGYHDDISAETVAKAYLRQWATRHGYTLA